MSAQDAAPTILEVLIVGAGFSGLAMAIRCKQAGIGPLRVIEKAEGIGGTWHENTYPGAACDVPSHLYSLSFAPKADWTRMYAPQAEIRAYLRETAERNGLMPLIQLKTAFTGATWDEARALWQVETDRGPLTARVIVSGMGGLHHPAYPDLPGRDSFAGPAFHTAVWDHSVALAGKRIGVIGTGASAIQVVPELAKVAAHLTLFQRTPPWIMPKHDHAIAEATQARYRRLPLLRRIERARLFWLHELRALFGFTKVSKLTKQAEGLARHHLAKAVKDRDLRAKLTPNYRLGCKRVLISDDYYPTLQRPNVTLETGNIARITESGVTLADGTAHELDAIVYATGFDVTGSFARMDLVGRGGLRLADAWAGGGMGAYQGITVAGFPNYFMLLGPNTGLGHNSIVSMIEVQVQHVLDCLSALRRGARDIEVRPEAQARFLDRIRARLADSIWQAGGCRSWYLDAEGRNTTLWPDSVMAYRRSARRARMADYRLG
ncbi:flavin-containing monooxygenase [Methylobacterium pseudosasicola]|uniref:Predicted flavoprotein CzcO associated with the cation diffusion facilitator CzcD n=1 Tax=Methylobacterium pseudosasicola TaxID=582667 RepID=A0A1I4QBQ8_9HYPH|nr:NAD(P)/FAD-dependent oxidoreductase [Methylobacterium pseudosasicola]SFM37145.1 Predicted flavoprotein CzcO associated with the cation diffusion facilitator CzcD [Methylobacterium pseudosasicola]